MSEGMSDSYEYKDDIIFANSGGDPGGGDVGSGERFDDGGSGDFVANAAGSGADAVIQGGLTSGSAMPGGAPGGRPGGGAGGGRPGGGAGGGGSKIAGKQLAFQKEQFEKTFPLQEAGVTGTYQGGPTFERERWDQQFPLQEGSLTGYYKDSPTLERDRWLSSATGYVDGAPTLDRERWLSDATGYVNGAPTLDRDRFGLDQTRAMADITGMYEGTPTFDRYRFDTGMAWDQNKFGQQLGWEKDRFGQELGWEKERFGTELAWDKEKFGMENVLKTSALSGFMEGGALTEEARRNRVIEGLQTGELTGIYNNEMTDAAKQWRAQTGLDYVRTAAQLKSNPGDYFESSEYLRGGAGVPGMPDFLRELEGAATGSSTGFRRAATGTPSVGSMDQIYEQAGIERLPAGTTPGTGTAPVTTPGTGTSPTTPVDPINTRFIPGETQITGPEDRVGQIKYKGVQGDTWPKGWYRRDSTGWTKISDNPADNPPSGATPMISNINQTTSVGTSASRTPNATEQELPTWQQQANWVREHLANPQTTPQTADEARGTRARNPLEINPKWSPEKLQKKQAQWNEQAERDRARGRPVPGTTPGPLPGQLPGPTNPYGGEITLGPNGQVSMGLPTGNRGAQQAIGVNNIPTSAMTAPYGYNQVPVITPSGTLTNDARMRYQQAINNTGINAARNNDLVSSGVYGQTGAGQALFGAAQAPTDIAQVFGAAAPSSIGAPGAGTTAAMGASTALGTPTVPGQTAAMGMTPYDRDQQILNTIRGVAQRGAQKLAPGALERMSPTEQALFGSGLKASGIRPEDFAQQYKRSQWQGDTNPLRA